MDLSLEGRTAVVTGASRGIGLAVVQALAAQGARVFAGARSASAGLEALAGDGRVQSVQVDLGTPDGPARLAAAVDGPVDILVNNVGSAPTRPGGFISITDEQWAETFALNFTSAVRMTRAVLPGMLEQGSGAIVNVGSVNAELPDPMVLDYSAAKAALHSFAKGLSKEVGPRGIRVNTVCPGPVATDLWLGSSGVAESIGGATGATAEEVAKGAADSMLTGRFTRPEEVADLVVLLAGDVTGNVTGSVFRIDGGLIPTW